MTITVPGLTNARSWTAVCSYQALVANRGVCARVGADHVAIFRVVFGDAEKTERLFALSNVDPFCSASVLSRGLIGSTRIGERGESSESIEQRVYVASPMRKHRFDLASGVCLDDASVILTTYPVRVVHDVVEVGSS